MGGGNKSADPAQSSATHQSSQQNEPTPSSPEPQSSTPVEVTAPPQKEYIEVSAATMLRELENNAAAAQRRYKDKYVKVSGKLDTIDSDMDYISISSPYEDDFSLANIQCNVKKDDRAQENYIMNLSKGQWVTVYGKITDAGEVLGYWMDVDKFE